MVAGILLRSSWQFHRKHPLQLLLSMIGIVLGVGIVTSVLITNHSAVRAFGLASEALYGRATHHIMAANGLLDTEAAAYIQQHPTAIIAPVVEGEIIINNSLMTLIGLDPFQELQFGRINLNANNTNSPNQNFSLSAISFGQLPIWISAVTAQQMQLKIGESIAIGNQKATIAGTFDTASSAASAGLLVSDVSVAQVLLNRIGKIDRLELIVSDAVATELRTQLPKQWRMQAAAQQQTTMQAMTRGFQINLTAMSLLALLVGMFLIHNTMTFAVLQRREVFAVKRIVGLSARSIFAIVLGEALIFSAVASVIGLLCGVYIARGLLQLTTQTINDLYFVLHVQQIHLSPIALLGGLCLGIGSSVLAAVLAAREAAGVGALVARLPSQSLLLGFAALMMVISGYGLCIPWLSQRVLRSLHAITAGLGITLTFALGTLTNTMSRTGLAIAALAVAVSATFGVDIMIGSFRQSVDSWLTRTLQSDIYITLGNTDGTGRSTPSMVDEQWLKTLQELPAVNATSTAMLVDVATNFDSFEMLVLDPHESSEQGYELLDDKNSWSQFLTARTVLVSEPLANKHNVQAGSPIVLFTESLGHVEFTVAGVYRDYGSSHGRMVMLRDLFSEYWNNPTIGSVGLMLDKQADRARVIEQVKQQATLINTPVKVRDNGSIHAESLAIFDRTFAVTRVLRWLTMGVAFIGIFSALLAMHLERAKDFAVLRASGGSQAQLQRIIILQSLGMGTAAGILAIPLGWLMAEMLIHIINVRSFGWSMESFLPSSAIAETLLLATGAALLASIYPAWRLARQSLVKELRSE